MGIYCEINLCKPENGAFIGTAGTIVSGLIKYGVDEETVFNKITVSLKGVGTLQVEKRINNNEERKYYNSETYIDVDDVITQKDSVTPVGMYEVPFKFELTHNVPPTLTYRKWRNRCHVRCNITYYVRIKFERPGFMNFTKRFKKEITVISGIIPRLPTTEVIYGGQKKLTQIFARNPSTVGIKAKILNSVYKTGDNIIFPYEVTNDTNLAIKAVDTKLVEVYKFYINETEIVKDDSVVLYTESKTGAIPIGEKLESFVEIDIPSNLESAEFSKLFKRDYYVIITVHLPFPHRNHILEIPVQIGNSLMEKDLATTHSFEENPPSYWEAMNEYSDKNKPI